MSPSFVKMMFPKYTHFDYNIYIVTYIMKVKLKIIGREKIQNNERNIESLAAQMRGTPY